MPQVEMTCNKCGKKWYITGYGPYCEVEPEDEICPECGDPDSTAWVEPHTSTDEYIQQVGPDYWWDEDGEPRCG